MKMNIYRLVSYTMLTIIVVLFTMQTVITIQQLFNIGFNDNLKYFITISICALIPSAILILIMALINYKTRKINLFILPEIRFILKFLLYFAVFSIFAIWTTMVSSTFIYFNSLVIETHIVVKFIVMKFIVNRLIFSTLYSFIIIIFFNSLSAIDFKRIKK